MNTLDKAGEAYWDDNWESLDFPEPLDISDQSLDNIYNINLDRYFKKLLHEKQNLKVLEIGCAYSVWLEYFQKEFNAEISGLDYSKPGVEKTNLWLQSRGVEAEIHCADLFDPPTELLGQFDLVYSLGVVEHFEDTAKCLKSCAAFVKPGGQLFTMIPNIPSLIGFFQKRVDRSIYDIHMPLTKTKFIQAHKDADLAIEDADYFMSINLSVVHSGQFSSHPLNPLFRRGLSGISKSVWTLERFGIPMPKNRVTSPYIYTLASHLPYT